MEYIHTYLTDDECNQVLKAFELADKAHEGQLELLVSHISCIH